MKLRDRRLFLIVIVCALAGCSELVIDRSGPAFAAGDMTLVSSCTSAPGPTMGLAGGVDSCQFTVGDTVSGNWVLISPPPKSAQNVTGGTVDVYYKDQHKSYPVSGWTIPISFSDFLGITTWSSAYDEGIIEALVTINWVDNTGVDQVTQFRGIAVLLVTAQGYNRMPIDSGNSAWGTTCKVQASTAGRTAFKCQ